jgi:hypothetical protein
MDRQEVTKQCQKTFQAGDGKFINIHYVNAGIGTVGKESLVSAASMVYMNETFKNNIKVNQPFEANNTQYKRMLILVIYVENTLVSS